MVGGQFLIYANKCKRYSECMWFSYVHFYRFHLILIVLCQMPYADKATRQTNLFSSCDKQSCGIIAEFFSNSSVA